MRSAVFLVLLLLAPPGLADEESVGARLARSLEAEANASRRTALLEQVKGLDGADQNGFVEWATKKREQGGWTRLAPALALIGTRAAASELGVVARGSVEGSMNPAEALAALVSMPESIAVPELFKGCIPGQSREVRNRSIQALGPLMGKASAARALVMTAEAGLNDEERAEGVTKAVHDLLGSAMSLVGDPAPLLQQISSSAPIPLIQGVVQGIGARDLGPREADPESGESKRDTNMAAQLAEALLGYAQNREDAQVLAEVFLAAPNVVDRLGPEWAAVLIPAVDHVEKPVSDAAWKALKSITGHDAPQAAAPWQEWWNANKEDQ